ncbi:hypothetical protein LSAT2_015430 [Lamellibrachia satsuma]|nr:hypothetical protein LSAT2_015430 [Lamellibrachia satsuma]
MLLPIPVSGTLSGDGTPVVQSVPLASTIAMPTHNVVNFASNSYMFPSPSVPTSGGGFTFTPFTTSYMPFQFPSPTYRAQVPVSGSSAVTPLSLSQCPETGVFMGGRSTQADVCHVTNSCCTTLPKPCSFVRPTRMRCFKRRANIIEDCDIPHAKVHINEERMTACMQQLHLDNNNLGWHPNREERFPRRRARTLQEIESRLIEEDEDEELENEMATATPKGLKRLELSKTLKLGLHTKEILPKAVIEDLRKPCMQLVLWKPPGDMICNVVKEVTKHTSDSGSMDVEVINNITGTNVTHLPLDMRTGLAETASNVWCPASSVIDTSPPVVAGHISMPLQMCAIDDDEMEL